MQPTVAPAPNDLRAAPAIPSPAGREWGLAWPVAILAALVYTGCFATFIARHTAYPFYDGYGYVAKTWIIADRFQQATFFGRINPRLYLNPPFAERPPLLPA